MVRGAKETGGRGVISFSGFGQAKSAKNETNVSPCETKRIPGRKSLESLWALNQSFRGLVCFQWVNRRFISRFFTYRSRIDQDKCEAGLMGFLKNNIKFRPAWQEIVGFSQSSALARDRALSSPLGNAERSHQPTPALQLCRWPAAMRPRLRPLVVEAAPGSTQWTFAQQKSSLFSVSEFAAKCSSSAPASAAYRRTRYRLPEGFAFDEPLQRNGWTFGGSGKRSAQRAVTDARRLFYRPDGFNLVLARGRRIGDSGFIQEYYQVRRC